MSSIVEFWYPNYRNNPGIVSKELRHSIRQTTKHFDVDIGEGYFEGYEKYLLEIDFHNPAYQEYITEQLHQRYGKFHRPHDLAEGDEVLGRMVSPGKVGFGVFVDIGVRRGNKHSDALLPLYQMRDDLALDDHSTREIVKMLGLIDGYPIPVIVDTIEKDPNIKINLRYSKEYINQVNRWAEEDREKMIFTKTLESNINSVVNELELNKYIENITSIDPLTTIITCDAKTNASGLIPKLGARLRNVPIGIFHP